MNQVSQERQTAGADRGGLIQLILNRYMPALVASQWEPAIKAHYRHFIDHNGLKKIQAVCAVMRKLLHAIHAMLRTRSDFDGSKFCLPRAVQP